MSASARRVASQHLLSSSGSDRLPELLGFLRALHFLHWTTHWQVQGNPSYGDHLLFERLYEGLVSEIDTLAEKLVAQEGAHVVAPVMQAEMLALFMSSFVSEGDLILRSLKAEQALQKLLSSTYTSLKQSDQLSLGMDDFLMSLASAHETHVYLLKQRSTMLRQANYGFGPPGQSAAKYFFDRPKSKEVREFAESGALTNSFGVADVAIKNDDLDASRKQVYKEVNETPLTVAEIEKLPGASEFSTLTRYVVETAQPTHSTVPQSRDELLARKLANRWMRTLGR